MGRRFLRFAPVEMTVAGRCDAGATARTTPGPNDGRGIPMHIDSFFHQIPHEIFAIRIRRRQDGGLPKGNFMNSTRYATVLAAVSGMLFLTGCGLVDSVVDNIVDSIVDEGSDRVQESIADAQTAAPEATRAEAAQAANTLPGFGSVTQSSNSGASNVTSDTASASFDGTDISLTVEREDGSRLTLGSTTGRSESEDIDLPIPDRSGRAHLLLDFAERSISVAAVYTSWNDSDPMNYLAGGYWVHIAGDLLTPHRLEVEVGAFMDGPELAGTPALPALGTASYQGLATGIFAYEYGTGDADRPRGSAAAGQYVGAASLNADFAAGTISGRIDEMSLSAVGATPDGEEFTIEDADSTLHMDLGRIDIRPDGTFAGAGVTVGSPDRMIASSRGSWGGRFSTIEDAAGDPRLVGGTTGAEWRERNGSEGVLVGAYFATKAE